MELPRYRSQTLPQVAAESPFFAAAGAGATGRAIATGLDVVSDVANRISIAEAESTATAALTDLQVKAREFVSNEKWNQTEIDGRPTDDVLLEEWASFSQSIEAPKIGNLNARNQYENARKRILSDAGLTVDSLRDKVRIDRTRANDLKAANNLWTLGNYNAGKTAISGSLGYNEQEKQRIIQAGAADTTVPFIKEDPYKALEELKKPAGESEQPFINDLELGSRNALINRAEQEIAQLEAQQRAEAAARQAQANSLAGYASDYLSSAVESIKFGIRPAPEGMAQVKTIIDGLEDGPRKAQLQGKYAAYANLQSSGFLELPPTQQQAQVTNFMRQMQQGEFGTPAVELLSMMRAVAENSSTAARNDPALYAQRQGIVAPPEIPRGENLIGQMADAAVDTGLLPLDPTINAPVNTLGAILSRAAANADVVSSYVGFPAPGLTNEQIEQLGRAYEAGNIDVQRNMLTTIIQTHGQAKAVDLLSHINKTMGPDMAAAGVLALEDPVAANYVLRGQRIRKEGGRAGKPLAPPSIDFPAEINARLYNAYVPGSPERNIAESAIRDVYMALAAESGVLTNPTIDTGLMEKAVQMVTGGIVHSNGVYTPAPRRGVTQAEFDGFVADLNESDFASAAGMEPAYAAEAFRRDGRLLQRQKGVFEVQIPHPSGDGYISIMDSAGKPVKVQWREATEIPNEPIGGGWGLNP